MVRKTPARPFTPDAEQQSLIPRISGNAINGLGEDRPRRARLVYWSPDPGRIPHGELQRDFYRRSAKDPRFLTSRTARQAILDAALPPLAESRVERSPEAWTAALDPFVTDGHCDKVGVARMQTDWVFEGQEIAQTNVIMIGVAHDYSAISTAPDATAGLEVMHQYARAAAASKSIAGWLRQQGWEADALTGPLTGALAMIPPALACGFGELGKHGSLITPEFGASFRLSAVLTDAPFAPTSQQDHGIDAFCRNCRICEVACPPEAIAPEKQTVRGTEKWYVDFDRCLPYFNETHGCAICIAVCPWSRPGVGLNLAEKLARRAERKAQTDP
ncbi:MAG: 4Fe-4S dicluster domain-containing protein [Pseudomonadota bacterium]